MGAGNTPARHAEEHLHVDDIILHQGRWLALHRRGRWEYATRVNPVGAVIIVALTPARELLLVEQWREAVRARTLELPAGLVGDTPGHEDESLEEATRRELEEETGYRCAAVQHLHSGPPSAGMSAEIVHFMRATDLERVGPGGGDAGEYITVHAVRPEAMPGWLAGRAAAGLSIDPKLLAGLWLLQHPGPYNAPDPVRC